jgi:hypothetical protein
MADGVQIRMDGNVKGGNVNRFTFFLRGAGVAHGFELCLEVRDGADQYGGVGLVAGGLLQLGRCVDEQRLEVPEGGKGKVMTLALHHHQRLMEALFAKDKLETRPLAAGGERELKLLARMLH